MMQSRQSAIEQPESLQNFPCAKSDATKPLYQVCDTTLPDILENTVGKTVSEEDSSDFNLNNELNINNNVTLGHKDVCHLSVVY
jgi:hypothetical protein